MIRSKIYALAVVMTLGSPAVAHVYLSQQEAQAGTTITLSLGIDHGCTGQATTRLRARIPEGIVAVLPVVKPGWTIETVQDRYATPHKLGAVSLREGVVEVQWSNGEVPEGFFDEFSVRARVADDVAPGTTLWIPVIQECVTETHRWIGLPEEGQDPPEFPAPGLLITAPGEAASAQGG
jgi:uncharacterized protein YcnI